MPEFQLGSLMTSATRKATLNTLLLKGFAKTHVGTSGNQNIWQATNRALILGPASGILAILYDHL
jgi:hypothetical protein